MIALMMGSAVLIPHLRESEETVATTYYVFAAVLSVGAAAYAFLFERKVSEGMLFWLLPLAYVISVALLLLVEAPLVLPFWCFGGILLLSAFKIRYAVLLNYYLLFLIGSTGSQVTKEALVMQVLCLLLLGFVMPLVKKWTDAVNVIISVIALLVSVRIIFFFTAKQEILDDDIFGIALVYVVIILAATLFSRMLQSNTAQTNEPQNFDFLEELAASAEVQDAELLQEMEAEQSVEEKFATVLDTNWAEVEASVSETAETEELVTYTEASAEDTTAVDRAVTESDAALTEALSKLCNEEAELLVKLSKEHPSAFFHARRVALIASEIAERLEGVNALLVKTGGYYHEIGRVLGKNTLENTLLAAEAEDFPAPLVSVLREHTVNGDKPTTKEAALVFLTDNICSMCEYLKKSQGGRVLIEKVIDKALNLRITKGDLNASGLSIKEFSVIRNTMAEIIKEDMF
ncbi:MAG: HD domain-containing protein [Lachnospiraceae bacterium]|nr:HD domain-containing protein [Lachnospiraceae bacterium]